MYELDVERRQSADGTERNEAESQDGNTELPRLDTWTADGRKSMCWPLIMHTGSKHPVWLQKRVTLSMPEMRLVKIKKFTVRCTFLPGPTRTFGTGTAVML
jgi:hypothetical protein